MLCISCTTPLRHFYSEKVLCSYLFTLQRFGDLNGIVLESWGYKCIIFRGINRSILLGGRAKESDFMRCIIFRSINRSIFWRERQRNLSSPEALLRIELAWMLRTLHFFVSKHYIKWILINFCFNTWSHRRLSCAVNFQGVCGLRLYVGLGKREGAIASHMGLGSPAEEASAPWMLLPSFHRCGVGATLLLCHLFNQKDPQELWLLVLLAGWLYYVLTGVHM